VKQYVLSVLLIIFCELPALAAKPSPCDLVLTKKNLTIVTLTPERRVEIAKHLASGEAWRIYKEMVPSLGEDVGHKLLALKNLLLEQAKKRSASDDQKKLNQLGRDEGQIRGYRLPDVPQEFDVAKSDAQIEAAFREVGIAVAHFEVIQRAVRYSYADPFSHDEPHEYFPKLVLTASAIASTTVALIVSHIPGVEILGLIPFASLLPELHRQASKLEHLQREEAYHMTWAGYLGLPARMIMLTTTTPLTLAKNIFLARKMKQSFFASLSKAYGDKITNDRAKKRTKKTGPRVGTATLAQAQDLVAHLVEMPEYSAATHTNARHTPSKLNILE
jgi:hypothetical protein